MCFFFFQAAFEEQSKDNLVDIVLRTFGQNVIQQKGNAKKNLKEWDGA